MYARDPDCQVLLARKLLLAAIVTLVNKIEAQASLSAALLVMAYILQQRFRPFLVSSTLSVALELDAATLELRLQQQRELVATKRHMKKMRSNPSLLRRRSRATSSTPLSLTAIAAEARAAHHAEAVRV